MSESVKGFDRLSTDDEGASVWSEHDLEELAKLVNAGNVVPFTDPQREEWNDGHCCPDEKACNGQIILRGIKEVRDMKTGSVRTYGPRKEHGQVIRFDDIEPEGGFIKGISGHSTRIPEEVHGLKF